MAAQTGPGLLKLRRAAPEAAAGRGAPDAPARGKVATFAQVTR